MFRSLIESYIDDITEEDIISFAENDDVIVTKEEASLFIKTVKENKEDILNGNGQKYIDDLKDKLSPEAFDELNYLWGKYKKFIG